MKRITQKILTILLLALSVSASATKPPDLKILKQEARTTALNFYSNHRTVTSMPLVEGASEPVLVQLDFPVDQFSKEGDWLWEVRIQDRTNRLQAIIWVHTQTKQVHQVVGK